MYSNPQFVLWLRSSIFLLILFIWIYIQKYESVSTIIILQLSVPAYQEVARKMKNFTKLLDLLRESDASCVLPKTGFIELIDDVPEGACDGSLQQLLSLVIKVYLIILHIQVLCITFLHITYTMSCNWCVFIKFRVQTMLSCHHWDQKIVMYFNWGATW